MPLLYKYKGNWKHIMNNPVDCSETSKLINCIELENITCLTVKVVNNQFSLDYVWLLNYNRVKPFPFS